MGHFSVKDFERHQHYKDRRPPWIKLYNDLLSDYGFCKLPDASKMHLVSIWLLASRYENRVPNDPDWIATQISATEKVDLGLLAEAGFIVMDQGCSETLAECKQNAMPEKETETEVETEVEKKVTSAKADDTHAAYDLWNILADEIDVPKARRTQGPTLDSLKRLLGRYGLEGWGNALNGIRSSPHHQGENKTGWRIDMPWLVANPKKFESLMMKGETYGDRGSPGRKASAQSGINAHMAGMVRAADRARARRGEAPEAPRVGGGTAGKTDPSAAREGAPSGTLDIDGDCKVLPSR